MYTIGGPCAAAIKQRTHTGDWVMMGHDGRALTLWYFIPSTSVCSGPSYTVFWQSGHFAVSAYIARLCWIEVRAALALVGCGRAGMATMDAVDEPRLHPAPYSSDRNALPDSTRPTFGCAIRHGCSPPPTRNATVYHPDGSYGDTCGVSWKMARGIARGWWPHGWDFAGRWVHVARNALSRQAAAASQT